MKPELTSGQIANQLGCEGNQMLATSNSKCALEQRGAIPGLHYFIKNLSACPLPPQRISTLCKYFTVQLVGSFKTSGKHVLGLLRLKRFIFSGWTVFASNIGLFADKFDDMIFFGFCHLWYLFNPLTSFEHSHVKFVTSSHFARFALPGQRVPPF